MKKIVFVLFITVVIFTIVGQINTDETYEEIRFDFLNKTNGMKQLTTEDDFLRNLSPFDLSARLKTNEVVSLQKFKKFIGEQVLDWDEAEITKMETVINSVFLSLKPYKFLLPEKIYMVKTTGREEGNAAYCRGLMTIVFPQSYVDKSESILKDLLIHELFHILSRNNLQLQEKLYDIIGFKEIGELTLPNELASIKITNPDGFNNNYFFSASINDESFDLMPILLATMPYDTKRGGYFFEYLSLYFIAIDSEDSKVFPLVHNEEYLIYPASMVPDYFNLIGENTNYIIHPEEILADNFKLLVNSSSEIKTTRITTKLKEVLLESN